MAPVLDLVWRERGADQLGARRARRLRRPPKAAAELGALFTPAGDEHPWPILLPPSWHSRGKEPTVYTRVIPAVVVEGRVDVATPGGERWRHGPRYLRVRPDLTPEDVPLDLEL